MEPTLIRNNKIFNNQKKLITVLSILFICLFIGTSYSILVSTDESEEVITFQVGELNLEVKTSTDKVVNLQDELPKSEEEVETPIILNLKNSGSLTICEYRLKLISDPEATSDLPTKYIRYAVSEDNGTSYSESKLLSESDNQIYAGFNLKSEATKTIYLKVWLDSEASEDETILDKSFYGKIDAELLQRCEVATEFLKTTMGKPGGIVGVTNDNLKVTTENENIREYRYSGLGVKNYVTFNNEIWRIIGVFKDEKGEDHIKLIRDKVLEEELLPSTYEVDGKKFQIKSSGTSAYWDWDGSSTNNNWADAGLMNWLNSKGEENGYLKKLSETAQNMIYEAKWYLGNFVYDSFGDNTVSAYEHERGSEPCTPTGTYPNCKGGDIWSGNDATWNGKIALMYPSDYGFSADSTYWGVKLTWYSDVAKDSSWLHKQANRTDDVFEWFLSPTSAFSYTVGRWDPWGSAHGGDAYNNYGVSVRPSLYLNSQVMILDGTGSLDNPYQLG